MKELIVLVLVSLMSCVVFAQKHRNSTVSMNGWDTDAYHTAMTVEEGSDRTKPENIKRLFIGHGSCLRKDVTPVVHALSKFFATDDFEGNSREIEFGG